MQKYHRAERAFKVLLSRHIKRTVGDQYILIMLKILSYCDIVFKFISLISINFKYRKLQIEGCVMTLYSWVRRNKFNLVLYEYNIPVGCPPGRLFPVDTPQRCYICFIIPNKMQNTKGEKILRGCLWVFFGLAVTNQLWLLC